MLICFAFLILLSCADLCDNIPTNANLEEAFNCIDSITYNETQITAIKGYLSKLFNAYIYKDIVKSPPQPDDYSSYYSSIDIDAELALIPDTTQSAYTFIQQIQSIIFATHDLHLYLSFSSTTDFSLYFENYFAVLPFTINPVYDANETNFFIAPLVEVIPFGVTIPDEITTHQTTPIHLIDGIQPTEWIQGYADEFCAVKSPHARFTLALQTLGFFSLADQPVSKDYLLTPIEITYEDGISVNVSYSL